MKQDMSGTLWIVEQLYLAEPKSSSIRGVESTSSRLEVERGLRMPRRADDGPKEESR